MAHLKHAKNTFEPLSAPDNEPNELEVLGSCGDPWQRPITSLTACPSDSDFGATSFDRLMACETGCEHEGPGELDEGVPMQEGAQARIKAGHGEMCPGSSSAAAESPTAEEAADREAFVLRRSECVHPWLTPFQHAVDWGVVAALPTGFKGEWTDFELLAAVDPTVVHVWEEGGGHGFSTAGLPDPGQQSAEAGAPALAPLEQAGQ